MSAERIRIPSAEECRRLAAGMGMMEHIAAHSRQVCRVALLIADHLKRDGLDRELIRAAALLHDITKTRSLETSEDHAETGERLLAELGYPEVGRIVGQHVHLEDHGASAMMLTEAGIVNYSDKRVLHEEIVPLGERMGYILNKYGRTPERKRELLLLWKKTEIFEKLLFDRLPFAPGDIGRLIVQGAVMRVSF